MFEKNHFPFVDKLALLGLLVRKRGINRAVAKGA